jgi:hypothetical protein
VPDLDHVVALAAYYQTLLFLDRSGVVYGQGDNSYHQLTGAPNPTTTPTELQLAAGYSPLNRIVEVAVSPSATLVRGVDGVVLGAGADSLHQLTGDTATVDQLTILHGQKVINYARPTITGSPKVGKTLHAHAGKWSVVPGSYSYQWFRGHTGLNAHGKTYHPVRADRGHKLHVVVTGTRNGFSAGTAASAATTKVG